MKTSVIESKQIEQHLLGLGPAEDKLVFEANLLLSPALQEKVQWQQKTYQLVQLYGRQQLKAELEAVHQKLFQAPEHRSFRQRILQLFSHL
ncbi:hypothetical protein [Rufibacter quisquiliarum]|uniref:Uncharacterized protein n=1 Tax=Rufibacter quisquiliarum TaxID=1549639 RepID=A0A839GK12_9BACT|nr:hypothetical protein [Rufibacter quisquiliarum]MBA9075376.1 hypothetical protein [Rufibacter quisquiliarum]